MTKRLRGILTEVRGIPSALVEQRLSTLPENDRRELIRDGVISANEVHVTHHGWEVIRSCRPL